jgi:hypothetical protein
MCLRYEPERSSDHIEFRNGRPALNSYSALQNSRHRKASRIPSRSVVLLRWHTHGAEKWSLETLLDEQLPARLRKKSGSGEFPRWSAALPNGGTVGRVDPGRHW